MRNIIDTVGVWSGIVTAFVGLPALALTYCEAYKTRKEVLEAHKRSEVEGMVKFVNVRDRTTQNIGTGI